MKEIDKYMTPAEAAHRWGVSQETVKNKLKLSVIGKESLQNMVDQGLVKYFQKPGGMRKEWIISEKAMELWFGKKN